jgi:hypothetical protein
MFCRYVLGPPHVAAGLLHATLQGWAMQDVEPPVGPKPETVSTLNRAPVLDPQKDPAWSIGKGSSDGRGQSVKKGIGVESSRIGSFTEPLKPHLMDDSMVRQAVFQNRGLVTPPSCS